MVQNENEFDRSLENLSLTFDMSPDELKYIRIKFYLDCSEVKEIYQQFCNTCDIEKY